MADKICKEDFGIVDGIKGSYNAIFSIELDREIQILIPYLKKEWICGIKKCSNKFV